MNTSLRKKVVALTLLLLALGFTCYAQQTLTVPDDYSTIQAAIDAAQPEDTVYIKAGQYVENLVLTKKLTLRGDGCRVDAADSSQPVVVILARSTRLDGLIVSHGVNGVAVGSSALQYRVPAGWSAPQAVIINCQIRDNSQQGIVVKKGSNAVIIGSVIEGNGWSGVDFEDKSSGEVTTSTIRRNTTGIEVGLGSTVKVMNAVLTGNVISSGELYILSTQLTCEDSPYNSGIRVFDGSHTVVRDSTISGYSIGVDAGYAAGKIELELLDNVIRNNKVGIESSADDGSVSGSGNICTGNGIDLIGNVPSGLRVPLAVPHSLELRLPNERYPTLQQAVDALLPGGKLILGQGTYIGGVVIDKELSIDGVPSAEVSIVSGRVGVSVVGTAHVVVRNLTFRNTRTSLSTGADSAVTLLGCRIEDNGTFAAIEVKGRSTLTVIDSAIQNNWNGAWVVQEGHAAFVRCTIQGNYTGVLGAGRAALTLTECNVVVNESGISLDDEAKARIANSTFENNEREGLFVLNWAEANLSKVEFHHNNVGIYVGGFANLKCHDVVLTSNKISIATWTPDCAVGYAYELFMGEVEGEICTGENSEAALCPPYPGYPWPDGFLKEVPCD